MRYGSILLREARNLNNESALAIIMSNKCPLINMLNNSEEIEFFQTRIEDDKKTGKPYTVVCIPEDNLHHFKNFIFKQKIGDAHHAAKGYGDTITSLVSQLTNSMTQDNNPGAHMETLDLLKETLTNPSLINISLCEQQAKKISNYEHPDRVFSIGKIISGTLLCLAGALTIALAATLIIASTAITMGASIPLSLPAGIGIGAAGLSLIVAGTGLIASGGLDNQSSVTSTFKNLYQEIKSNDNQKKENSDDVNQSNSPDL